MPQKPSIPKGTRDFSPAEVTRRNYIINTVKKHFEIFGFQPIETPSFENSDTLLGKYGDEGDRLIFKILDSGDYFGKIAGDIERTFLLIVAFNNTFNTLTRHVLKSDFFKYRFINFDLLTEQEINQLTVELIDSFRYNLKRNLSLLKRGLGSKFYINQIENQIDFDFLIRKKYLNYLEKLTWDLDRNKLELAIKKGSINKEKFSKEIVELIIDKKINLINPISSEITQEVSEKALRYDLTVPFARYVVMHQNDIDFPFKRYQIQPVWRADRPQKGRFREFYQCDADVVGANSLLQEVEFVQLYDAVFTDLGLKNVSIKINNRKILAGITEIIGAEHLLIDFTVALDKLDKIGEDGVTQEMIKKGIPPEAVEKATSLFPFLKNNSNNFMLTRLDAMLESSEKGKKGVEELRYIVKTIEDLGLQSAKLEIDVTLARGLNYYTGAIFEVAAPASVEMGSIGGGGRYDDLTGIFGLKDVSGIGISFGLDRIYLVLEELGLFPATIDTSLDVLCLNFGEKEGLAAQRLVKRLRELGLRADLYPSDVKVQKQMKYADKRNVPNVILLGQQELSKGEFVVKNMKSGEQKSYALASPEAFAQSQ